MAATVYLYVAIPKGFFPIQDTGLVTGFAEAGQDISPQEMARLMVTLGEVVQADPDVAAVGSAMGSTGSAQTANTGRFFIALKPRDQRTATASDIINRLRPQLAKVEGVSLVLQPSQDITVGGRIGRGQFQYTLQDADIDELNAWAPKVLAKLRTLPELADASSDLQGNSPQLSITHQPRPGGALRHPARGDRRHAQRRLRPAPGGAILHADQHLSRDPRSAAGDARRPHDARPHLSEVAA